MLVSLWDVILRLSSSSGRSNVQQDSRRGPHLLATKAAVQMKQQHRGKGLFTRLDIKRGCRLFCQLQYLLETVTLGSRNYILHLSIVTYFSAIFQWFFIDSSSILFRRFFFEFLVKSKKNFPKFWTRRELGTPTPVISLKNLAFGLFRSHFEAFSFSRQ